MLGDVYKRQHKIRVLILSIPHLPILLFTPIHHPMVEATLVSSSGVKRTYNQFIKSDEISNKFKCKRDFIKYFKECCK